MSPDQGLVMRGIVKSCHAALKAHSLDAIAAEAVIDIYISFISS